ncbi:MAG: hypothetical protein ACU85V_05190, partial [Gammaproteobacteria bacterium]
MRHTLFSDLLDIYTSDAPACAGARRWRFEAAFQHAVTDAAGNLVATAALAAILYEAADPRLLATWFVTVNLLSLARVPGALLWPRLDAVGQRRAAAVFV